VLVLLATLWNAGCLLRSHGLARPHDRRLASILAVGLILTCVGRLSTRPELSAPRPPGASLQVAAMAPDTAAALRRGAAGTDGAVGPYVVSWEDALFGGGQGIGLLVELERRGIRAYLPASPFNSSIVGPHRVTDPNGAKARIHIVNGAWVEETRSTLGAVQVAYSDPRTAAERAESEIAIGRLAQALRRIGRPDLVPLIEHRLTSIDSPKLTPWDKLVIGHVSDLGMPAAVFIMPK